MSRSFPEIKDPPKNCPFCKSKRIGIQEGEIFFVCGTVANFKDVEINKKMKYKKSPTCRVG
jgi:hypothetical protein